MAPGFATVTDQPGDGATDEQLSMLYARYHLAASLCRGLDTLEVACGAGMGLGYLSQTARRLVGGDCEAGLLARARAHYRDRVPLLRLDAHALPFADRSFDVVVLFEAIYYLDSPDRFVEEARRILRPHGRLVICTANKEWNAFNPSPLARRYFSASELARLLAAHRFTVELYGGFPVCAATIREHVVLGARKVAVALHLIPATMRGKRVLKRFVFGRLSPLPLEIQEGMARAPEFVALPAGESARAFKVLYAIGSAL